MDAREWYRWCPVWRLWVSGRVVVVAAGVMRVERRLRVLFAVFRALLAWVEYEAKIGSGTTKIVTKWAKMASFVKICEKIAFIFNFFVEMFGLC